MGRHKSDKDIIAVKFTRAELGVIKHCLDMTDSWLNDLSAESLNPVYNAQKEIQPVVKKLSKMIGSDLKKR